MSFSPREVALLSAMHATGICPENAGAEFFKDPIISPVYGTFNNFPPLFLSASDSEILYDDAVMLYQKAVNDGVKAHIEVINGSPEDGSRFNI